MKEDKPTGTGSIRYFKVPNTPNVWSLDLGILPLVISKDLVDIIKYYPSPVLLTDSFASDIFHRQLSVENRDKLKTQKELVMKYICSVDDRM